MTPAHRRRALLITSNPASFPLLCQNNGLWLRLPLSPGRQRRILSWQTAHSGMWRAERGDTRHRQVLPMVGEPQLLRGCRGGCCSLHVAPPPVPSSAVGPPGHLPYTSLYLPLPWVLPVELGSNAWLPLAVIFIFLGTSHNAGNMACKSGQEV